MGVVMKTGEVWLAQLDPTVGSEIQKTRPCVVQRVATHLHQRPAEALWPASCS
jgi:mRNA interferase MazF